MFDIIFVKGGWVVYLLLSLSVYALGIVFFKAYQFYESGVFNTRFVDAVMTHVKRGELTHSAQVLKNEPGPVARIMRVSIDCILNREMSMRSREAEISRIGASELRYLESHMRGLEMAATIAPLMGLMGTVIGMIKAFSKLSEAGSRIDPSMLAGGIWEALVTTVGGLMVAIPSLAAYYLIDSMIERVRATMRDVTIQVLALEDNFIRNEREQEKREIIAREEKAREESRREQRLREEKAKAALEEKARVVAEEQEKVVSMTRGAPQSSSTLRLLSPSYGKF